MMSKTPYDDFPNGFRHYPGYFSPDQQQSLIESVRAGVLQAPFYQPRMPHTGTPLSVVMSNFGPLGWVTDKDRGYRYEAVHPKTGARRSFSSLSTCIPIFEAFSSLYQLIRQASGRAGKSVTSFHNRPSSSGRSGHGAAVFGWTGSYR